MGNSYLRIPVLWEQGAGRARVQKATHGLDSSIAKRAAFSEEETFHSMLTLERRRAERSRKPFVLMVIETSASADAEAGEHFVSQVTSVLLKSIRETDIVGWYKKGAILGIIFTEISLEFATPITEILRTKIVSALQNEFGGKVASRIVVSVHLFPENRNLGGDEPPADIKLYPDLAKGGPNKVLPQTIKRVIDIAGSAALLLFWTDPCCDSARNQTDIQRSRDFPAGANWAVWSSL